ncbi:hypothetical protein PF008_g8760 [Phytophthora fragariae]|uniref:Secreted protein n=1 Tax=Phytophthora fragariae TaxID=53985 RepID=A0A6G0S081_9STRA|nr:hypothetical protein PF008_g8760 [Phytophthora fragariae]
MWFSVISTQFCHRVWGFTPLCCSRSRFKIGPHIAVVKSHITSCIRTCKVDFDWAPMRICMVSGMDKRPHA